jgi:hypothetical protein
LVDSDFRQILRKRKTGLIVTTRVVRILPDTVTYVVKQNIMLRVVLKNLKIPRNLLNLNEILICTVVGQNPYKNQTVRSTHNISL